MLWIHYISTEFVVWHMPGLKIIYMTESNMFHLIRWILPMKKLIVEYYNDIF